MATRQTANRGYPYPAIDETPNAPRDLQALATAVDQDMNRMVPIGTIIAFAGATTPGGWLLCNGQSFSAVTYPALASLLGATTVPNLVDRFIKGSTTAGATGGSNTITIANLPAHGHGGSTGDMTANATHTHTGSTSSDGAHQHQNYLSTRQTYQSGGNLSAAYHPGAAGDVSTLSSGTHNHSFTTAGTNIQHQHSIPQQGGGQDYNPPFYAVRYLIKAS